jgi:hypothetical protein
MQEKVLNLEMILMSSLEELKANSSFVHFYFNVSNCINKIL